MPDDATDRGAVMLRIPERYKQQLRELAAANRVSMGALAGSWVMAQLDMINELDADPRAGSGTEAGEGS